MLRLVVATYAVTVNLVRFEEFSRPGLAALLIVVLVGWTAFVTWAYDAPHRRRLGLYLADLALAVLLILSTPVVQSEAMLERHASTVPTFWVMAPVLAWSAGRAWWQAVGAAVLVSAADVSVRTQLTGGTWGNIFLLLLAAGVVGYAAQILRDAAETRAAAERAAAAYEERVRLARAVHDGVLQVLALVQRRGTEAGGALADLGRLAGEQEAALRALVQAQARDLRGEGGAHGLRSRRASATADLMAALEPLGSGSVTVSGPGTPVLLSGHAVGETVAAVSACLDNVRSHVGPQARAWVFVEDLGGSVLVSVRDEGGGIPAGRLDQAVAEGRLGVSESIRGRLADLGGRADLLTSPEGTEWELTVPREEGR